MIVIAAGLDRALRRICVDVASPGAILQLDYRVVQGNRRQ
jgi:hypothetical protein